MKTVAIIGGGASGLAAACMLTNGGARILLLEKQSRVGRKLLSTGNGRCNLTNLRASPANYHGGAAHIRAALESFPPEKTLAFFESLGVTCVSDAEGRVYPASNAAAGVLDALRLYADERGAETLADFDAVRITPAKNGFSVTAADGRKIAADFVIVACGGLAAPKLGSGSGGYKLLEGLGHTTTPKLPAIAPLKTDPDAVRALKGVRMHGEIALIRENQTARTEVCRKSRTEITEPAFTRGNQAARAEFGGKARTEMSEAVRTEVGEILFNEGCISGIAAMQLAREVNLRMNRGETCCVRLNFCPNAPANLIDRRAELLPERTMDDFLSGIVPKRLGQVLIKEAGVTPLTVRAKELTARQKGAIYDALTGWVLPVRGTLGFDAAQVTCGGARLTEFDPNTLESKRVKNLFAAGEILDADGDCGGFNLQWAWAGAALCAKEILARIQK